MNQKTKGIVHNAFYTRNERKESLSCLFGMLQGSDLDMYDFEFNEDGSLKIIHMNKISTKGEKSE